MPEYKGLHCSKIGGNSQWVWLGTDAYRLHCSDWASSDFCLSGHHKEFLWGVKFSSNDEVKNTMNEWLKKTQSKDFYAEGIKKPVFQWEKCVMKNGNYTEK